MTSRRAGRSRTALLIVEAAVRTLPAGDIRSRYERELVAELLSLPRRRQLGYAVGTLTTVLALRRAVSGGQPSGVVALVVHRRRAGWCTLTGHHWRQEFTEDGQRYSACRDCGKVITDAVRIIDPFFQGGWGVR